MYKSASTPTLSSMTTSELSRGRAGGLKTSASSLNLRKRPKPDLSVHIPKSSDGQSGDATLARAVLLTPLPQKVSSTSSPFNGVGGSGSMTPTRTVNKNRMTIEELNRKLLGDDYVAPPPRKPSQHHQQQPLGNGMELQTKSQETKTVSFLLEPNDQDDDPMNGSSNNSNSNNSNNNRTTTTTRLVSYNDHMNRGVELICSRKVEGAIQCFSRAIEINGNDPSGWFNRGLAHIQIRDFDRAMLDFTNAIFNGCNESIAFFSRGMCHLSRENYKRAVADFTRALQLDSKDIESLVNRGMAHTKLGQYDAALKDYNMIIDLNPNNAMAYHYRSIVLLHKRQYAEALQDAENAYMKEKGNLEYQARLAKLREAMDEGAIGIFHD